MSHKATNVQQQQGDSHLKHNGLISTIPWPSHPCFDTMLLLPHILTLASTWGPCLPQPVSLLGPAPSQSPFFQSAQAIFEPISHIKTPTILSRLFFLLTPPMKMEQKEHTEKSAYKIQTPGNHPKERVQHSEHSKSLKSRM